MKDKLCKKYFGGYPNLDSRNKRKRAVQRINERKRLIAQEDEKASAEAEKIRRESYEAKHLKGNINRIGGYNAALVFFDETLCIDNVFD